MRFKYILVNHHNIPHYKSHHKNKHIRFTNSHWYASKNLKEDLEAAKRNSPKTVETIPK